MTDASLPSYKREEIIWDSPLSKDEKYTLLALNTFVDGNGECWPGNRKLSKMMSVPVSTLKRYIASLEEKGVVTRKRRYRKDGGETSSGKRVDFDAIAALTPSSSVSHPQPTSEPGGQPVDEPPPSPPVSHQELLNRTIQKESSHSTTTEKPKKKTGSSSERVKEEASLLVGNAQEVADYIANECSYLGDDGEIYPYRKSKALVRACEGHDKDSALKAVWSTWEFMDRERSQGREIDSPQAVICRALADWHQPSAQYEAKQKKAMAADRERKQHQKAITYVQRWAALAEDLDYIRDVDWEEDSWLCCLPDNPTVTKRMKLWELPPGLQHIDLNHLEDALGMLEVAV